ncbi:MAG: tetratricopeptide repeat protein [Sandaracinaceae bacterium]|jgi:DNA-binding transcriptional MerR regulator|nr:tetratricopeptide repeat protein [Sandaracinaceae bacterium]
MSEDQNNVIHVFFGKGIERGQKLDPPTVHDVVEGEPPVLHEREIDPVSDLYGIAEVARVVGVSQGRLRYWDRTAFVRPSGSDGKRRLYTFQDLIGLRTAKGLLDHGVPLQRVRASVDALVASLPRVTRPLAELRVVADGHTVVVRGDEPAFEPQSGQLVIDFNVGELRDDVVRALALDGCTPAERKAAYDHYLEGCRFDEEETTFERAEKAYRRAIELDPSLSNAITNLGNLRFRQGHSIEAEALYLRALKIDGGQPEAFYNLGFLSFERGDVSAAVGHFEKAVAQDPGFSDAHFNLAMALTELGRASLAKEHWEHYLVLEPDGAWSEIARRHLSE